MIRVNGECQPFPGNLALHGTFIDLTVLDCTILDLSALKSIVQT